MLHIKSKSPINKLLVILAGLLLVYVCVATPIRHGDGHEYAITVKALASTGIPRITSPIVEKIIVDIAQYPNVGYEFTIFNEILEGLSNNISEKHGIFRDKDGNYYGYHFSTYPILVAITYIVLEQLGANVLKSFQITNGVIVIITGVVAVRLAGGNAKRNWNIIFSILASGLVYYIQWTHPEVLLFCLVYLSCVAVFADRNILSLLAAAIATSQTFSFVGLFAVLAVIITHNQIAKKMHNMSTLLITSVISATLCVSSPIFYFQHFGTPSLIAQFLDTDLISINHFISIYVDLDQGLFIGAPWMCAVFVASTVVYIVNRQYLPLHTQALTVLLSSVIIVPLLSNPNVNSGASVLQRYALFAGAPIAAWVGVYGVAPIGGRVIGAVLQGCGVVWMAVWGGPLAAEDNLGFKPWTSWIFSNFPALYSPEPGCFTGAREAECRKAPWSTARWVCEASQFLSTGLALLRRDCSRPGHSRLTSWLGGCARARCEASHPAVGRKDLAGMRDTGGSISMAH